MICYNGHETSICYILDIYVKKKLDISCPVIVQWGGDQKIQWEPIHFIFRYGTQKTIDHIVKIYIEKGLDFGCKTANKPSIFDLMKKNTRV